jgi:hypothetical protein
VDAVKRFQKSIASRLARWNNASMKEPGQGRAGSERTAAAAEPDHGVDLTPRAARGLALGLLLALPIWGAIFIALRYVVDWFR